jgi:hypothetical protein
MKFPKRATRLRPSGSDAYGNPGGSWATPSRATVSLFMVEKIRTTVNGSSVLTEALAPATADVVTGDRLVIDGTTFVATVAAIDSPTRSVLKQIALSPLPGSP